MAHGVGLLVKRFDCDCAGPQMAVRQHLRGIIPGDSESQAQLSRGANFRYANTRDKHVAICRVPACPSVVVVVLPAAAYATSVSSPSRSSFKSAKLPPLMLRLVAVRCIDRASGLFRHASGTTTRNDASDVETRLEANVHVALNAGVDRHQRS